MFKKKISPLLQAGILLGVGILGTLDQVIKYRVYQKGGFFNWRDFFDIGFYQNYGTAFGILIPVWILYLLIIIALIILFIRYFKFVQKRYLWASLAFLSILGGALSNIIDRINYGFVIDYLHFSFGSTFNLADCLIVIGVGMLVARELNIKDKN